MAEYGGAVITNPHDLETYLRERGIDKPFRIAYRDDGRAGVEMADVFTMLHDVPDMVLVLEEASKYMGPTIKEASVDWFFQYGRHNRQSIIAVARRPSELSRMATSQADIIVSFQQQEPRDVEYITKLAGSEIAEKIRNLGPHEWDYVINEHEEFAALLDSMSEEASSDGLADGSDSDSKDDSGAVGSNSGVAVAEEIPEGGDSDNGGNAGQGVRADGGRHSSVVPDPKPDTGNSGGTEEGQRGDHKPIGEEGHTITPSVPNRRRGRPKGSKDRNPRRVVASKRDKSGKFV